MMKKYFVFLISFILLYFIFQIGSGLIQTIFYTPNLHQEQVFGQILSLPLLILVIASLAYLLAQSLFIDTKKLNK
ncbi:ABC-type transport system involved in multi-copper enzyme maturation permease subunit [Cytobacillus purgationiresistens]|uniref:ABC-type transport system involved in multi-copper enzyme maturation permease subunit n=1 Tax=Cytobacillus purgationiresistens TaxID=863449 RepID=A0ABU0AQ48_9BACI|nr:ABC-type transport system involved in multi-copper enzyme maturation permease subunit [Cytobacillus purgationiresistens]